MAQHSCERRLRMITLRRIRALERRMRKFFNTGTSKISISLWWYKSRGGKTKAYQRVDYWDGKKHSPDFGSLIELEKWFSKQVSMRAAKLRKEG